MIYLYVYLCGAILTLVFVLHALRESSIHKYPLHQDMAELDFASNTPGAFLAAAVWPCYWILVFFMISFPIKK